MLKKGLHTVIIYLLISLYHFPLSAEPKVIGYYPHWLKSDLKPGQIDFENLTHIIHAFAWPNKDGTLTMYTGMIDPDLNYMVHLEGREILIALGGWGNSDAFSDVVADSTLRSYFISNIVSFIETNDYDGVDIDWEYPSSSLDKTNLTLFISELRKELDEINSDYLLTMAISSGNWSGQWFQYDELMNYCDWFGVMTYDFHGSWTNHAGHNSPMSAPSNCSDGSINTALAYLINQRRITPSQLVLGIPFYGKQFNASDLYKPKTGNVTDLRYNSIPGYINSGWNRLWDNFSEVPYLMNGDSTKIITYDDSISVMKKTEKAMEENLSGVMIWAIGHDIINGRQPLLESVGKSIRSVSVSKETPFPAKFRLYNNYPNPFNSGTTIQFRIPNNSAFSLDILDVNGRTVETLFTGYIEPGSHSIAWYPHNVPSGIYFALLKTNNHIITKKMVYVK